MSSSFSDELTSSAAPRSAASWSSPWISAFAATSTPRVGSSSSSTSESTASHLPSATFCWLPPLSVPTATSGDAARTRIVRITRSTIGAVRDFRYGSSRQRNAVTAIVRLSRTDRPSTSPRTFRSGGR